MHFERTGTLGYEAAVSVFALIGVIAFTAFVLINAARGERADRCAARPSARCGSRKSATSSSSRPRSTRVITINRHGIVTGWNTQAEKMFGWTRSRGAWGASSPSSSSRSAPRDDHRNGMRRYLESGVARVLNKRIEMTALHRDGHEFPVELAITPDRLRR